MKGKERFHRSLNLFGIEAYLKRRERIVEREVIVRKMKIRTGGRLEIPAAASFIS